MKYSTKKKQVGGTSGQSNGEAEGSQTAKPATTTATEVRGAHRTKETAMRGKKDSAKETRMEVDRMLQKSLGGRLQGNTKKNAAARLDNEKNLQGGQAHMG